MQHEWILTLAIKVQGRFLNFSAPGIKLCFADKAPSRRPLPMPDDPVKVPGKLTNLRNVFRNRTVCQRMQSA
jgi:hypothetical protein